MNDFLRYQRILSFLTLGIVLVGTLALFSMYPQSLQYAYGLLVGGLVGLIKLRLDVIAIMSFAANPNGEDRKAPLRTEFQGFLLLLGSLLLAVYRPELLSVWTVLAGGLIPRALLIGDALLRPEVAMTGMQTASEPESGEGDSQ